MIAVAAPDSPKMTVQEYLDWDLETEARASYIDGQIFPPEEVTWQHAVINTAFMIGVGNRMRDTECYPICSALRVQVGPTKYVYPDALVVWGKPALADGREDTLLNPKVIVEILSPTTTGYDYAEKFGYYRNLASFEEYVLISQTAPHVEVFLRTGLGKWELTTFDGIEASVELRSLGIAVPLSEIYRRVFEI